VNLGRGETGNSNPAGPRAPTLVRSNSEETLIDGDNSELVSLFTTNSEETLGVANIKIFGKPLSSYNQVKEFPIITGFLLQGTSIFESAESFKQHVIDPVKVNPFLHISPTWGSIFKKNAPYITIYTFEPQKTIFCQVYFKVISNWISYYRLSFTAEGIDDVILLNNNSYDPTVDFEYNGTKFRITGITGTTSTFGGNGLIKIFVMYPTSELLSNDMTMDESAKPQLKSKLSLLIEKRDRQSIHKLIEHDKPAVALPIATFIDVGSEKVLAKYVKSGVVKMFTNNDHTFETIMSSILLVLREQESRKFRGNNKPSYVQNSG